MPPPFPLSPAPAWFTYVDWKLAGRKRNGVHYVGESVSLILNATGPTAYAVRDYYGEVVDSGAVSGTTLNLGSNWNPGWYRVYFSGPNSNADFGNSYAVTNFCVVRDDSKFVQMPDGATLGSAGGENESPDFVGKGVMGIGTSRIQITDAGNPTTGADTLAKAQTNAGITGTYWTDPGAPYADAERPRYAWCQFPNGTYDSVLATGFLIFYLATPALDGSQVFVETLAGSSSGTKVNIYFPNATTLVETYDNLANEGAALTAINGVSDYVFVVTAGGPAPEFLTKTAIGNSMKQGVINVVSTLYPLGVTHFEGPANEPSMDWRRVNHLMMLFQDYVHQGNANAKAIGPGFVDLQTTDADPAVGWEPCLANGLADYCDEIAFHAYGDTGPGEINVSRVKFGLFLDALESHNVDKPLWQTESTSCNTPVGGIHMPVRAKIPILQTLLLEQFGVPKEQNNYWYDLSHGFWGIPNWFENWDGSLEPEAVLYRVLAEETWGKPYASALDFGEPGNQIFVGNVYTGSAGSTLAIMAQTRMPEARITLRIVGTSGPLTVVDAFGNSSSVVVRAGKLTVPVLEVPTYVQLPLGASALVDSCNDWPHGGLGTELSLSASSALLNGVSTPLLKDGQLMSDWGLGTGSTNGTAPMNADLIWGAPVEANRVVIWCDGGGNTLTNFDIQTTANGIDWTTVASVVKDDAVSFLHGCSSENTGTKWNTFWGQQWIFDVPFETTSITGLRVKINGSAYGALPDAQSANDLGVTTQTFILQEIGVYHVPTTGEPRRGGGAPPKDLQKRKAGDGEAVYQSYIILSG